MKALDCYPLISGVVISGFFCGIFWVLAASLMAIYSLYYFFAGVYNAVMDVHTPMWARCDQAWNSDECANHGTLLDMQRENIDFINYVSYLIFIQYFISSIVCPCNCSYYFLPHNEYRLGGMKRLIWDSDFGLCTLKLVSKETPCSCTILLSLYFL